MTLVAVPDTKFQNPIRISSPLSGQTHSPQIAAAVHPVLSLCRGSAMDFNGRAKSASIITPVPEYPYPKLEEGYSSMRSFEFNKSDIYEIPKSTAFRSSYNKLLVQKFTRRETDGTTPQLHIQTSSYSHQHVVPKIRPQLSARRYPQNKLQRCEILRKPKTEEELNHEMKKKYECRYCLRKYITHNEAKRHEDSLHLRYHSWSCAALPEYHSAFYDSPTRPTEADTCGYCGKEFLRHTIGQHDMSAEAAKEKDREVRIQHLVEVHNYMQCRSRKFFRADHFRQHLKHSHAGAAGKWNKVLENKCMKKEPNAARIIGKEEYIPT